MSIALPTDHHDIGEQAIAQYRAWRREVMGEGTIEAPTSSVPIGQEEPGEPGPTRSH